MTGRCAGQIERPKWRTASTFNPDQPAVRTAAVRQKSSGRKRLGSGRGDCLGNFRDCSLVVSRLTGQAARTQVKVGDFSNCLLVVKELAEAQRKVRDSHDEAVRQFEFRELLNLIEALALLINNRRTPPSTRDYAEHFLEEAWAWLRADPAMATLTAGSITGAETFSELLKFAEKRKEKGLPR